MSIAAKVKKGEYKEMGRDKAQMTSIKDSYHHKKT